MILVDENRNLYRGPLTDLTLLPGIKRIISLQSGIYASLHPDTLLERQFPCEFGMAQYDLHSSDVTPPEDWIVEKVLDLTADKVPTYLHCLSGVDRTGFVCAAYRMKINQWSFGAAVAEWKALGRHPWYFWWEHALKSWSPR